MQRCAPARPSKTPRARPGGRKRSRRGIFLRLRKAPENRPGAVKTRATAGRNRRAETDGRRLPPSLLGFNGGCAQMHRYNGRATRSARRAALRAFAQTACRPVNRKRRQIACSRAAFHGPAGGRRSRVMRRGWKTAFHGARGRAFPHPRTRKSPRLQPLRALFCGVRFPVTRSAGSYGARPATSMRPPCSADGEKTRRTVRAPRPRFRHGGALGARTFFRPQYP